MVTLQKIIKLLTASALVLVLFFTFGVTSSSAQSCTISQPCTGIFECCTAYDIHDNCIAGGGAFLCNESATTEYVCTVSDPNARCSSLGTEVWNNGCIWDACDCGDCSVGYECDCGTGSSGPATWKCNSGPCCCRPTTCLGESACMANGTQNLNRVGCGPCNTPTPKPSPTPIPTTTPTEPLEGEARPRYHFYDQIYPFPCDEVAPDASDWEDFEFHSLRPYQKSPCNPNLEDIAYFCGNDFILPENIEVEKYFAPLMIPKWSGIYYYFEPDMTVIILPGPPVAYNGLAACWYCADTLGIDQPFGECKLLTPLPIYCDDAFECPDGLPCIGNVCGGPTCTASGVRMCHPGDNDCTPSGCYDNWDGTETCFFSFDKERHVAIDLEGAYLPIMGYTEPSYGAQDLPIPKVINSVYQDEETLDDAGKVNEYVSWYLNGVIGRAEYPPVDPDTDEGQRKIIDFSSPLKRLLAKRSQRIIRRDEISDAGNTRHDQTVVCFDSLGQETPCYPDLPGMFDLRMSNVSPANYSYVPFSSTENRLGQVEFVGINIQPIQSNAFIYNFLVENMVPADLYFAHMQESVELAEILQAIVAPKEPPIDIHNGDIYTPYAPFCDLRYIRSNPGDNLFPGEVSADISWSTTIECEFLTPGNGESSPWGNLCRELIDGDADCYANNSFDEPPYCDTYYGQVDCEDGYTCGIDCEDWPVPPAGQQCFDIFGQYCVPKNWTGCAFTGTAMAQDCSPTGNYECPYDGSTCQPPPPESVTLTQQCSVDYMIDLPTITETPLADEIWSRLVAGPVGVFRHLFPQIGEDGPIESIWDIPAATRAKFTSNGPVLAGNPGSGRPADEAELYFPHIGGIHEYFLHCIQKTLKPEGYAEGCMSGPDLHLPGAECPSIPDEDVPAKWLGGFKANFIDLADRWTAACPGPENNAAEECYNYVVITSLARGVNPAFALTIWLNESGASNYCACGPTCQDFGVYVSSIYLNLVAQLDWFLNLPYTPGYLSCRSQPGWIEPMHAFLSRFRAGGCDPGSAAGTGYYNSLRDTTWQWVTGGCVVGSRYAISWPTDLSCP